MNLLKNRGDFCGPKKKIFVRIHQKLTKTYRNSYIPSICLKQKTDLTTHLSFSRCIQLMEVGSWIPVRSQKEMRRFFRPKALMYGSMIFFIWRDESDVHFLGGLVSFPVGGFLNQPI